MNHSLTPTHSARHRCPPREYSVFMKLSTTHEPTGVTREWPYRWLQALVVPVSVRLPGSIESASKPRHMAP